MSVQKTEGPLQSVYGELGARGLDSRQHGHQADIEGYTKLASLGPKSSCCPVPAQSKSPFPWDKVRAGPMASESIGVMLKLSKFSRIPGGSRFLWPPVAAGVLLLALNSTRCPSPRVGGVWEKVESGLKN